MLVTGGRRTYVAQVTQREGRPTAGRRGSVDQSDVLATGRSTYLARIPWDQHSSRWNPCPCPSHCHSKLSGGVPRWITGSRGTRPSERRPLAARGRLEPSGRGPRAGPRAPVKLVRRSVIPGPCSTSSASPHVALGTSRVLATGAANMFPAAVAGRRSHRWATLRVVQVAVRGSSMTASRK